MMPTWIYFLWGPFMQQNMYFSTNTQNHRHPATPVIQAWAHVGAVHGSNAPPPTHTHSHPAKALHLEYIQFA